MLKTIVRRPQLWTILFLILVTGCSSSDERLVELGQQSADRQAEQNQTIADQSQQVTETTHQFVESSRPPVDSFYASSRTFHFNKSARAKTGSLRSP
jgi:hypothetical protein